MKSRRNPASSSMVPLLLVGAGAAMLYASRQSSAVHGMGEMGSWLSKAKKKVKSSVSAVTKAVVKPVQNLTIKDAAVFAAGGGIAQAAKMGLTTAKALPSGAKALATGGVTALGVTKVVQKVMKGTRAPAPAPGSTIEYQDENGKVITRAEYERRQALYEAQSACFAKGQPWQWNGTSCQYLAPKDTSSAPAPASTPTDWSQVPQQAAQSAASGGGGDGGAPSPDQAPSAPDTGFPSQEAPAPATAGKINPLMAVAAFAAVPIVLGMAGEH